MEPPAYESVLKVPYFCFRSRNYIHFVVVLCSWAWRSSWYTGEVGGSIEEKTLVSDWFKKLAPSSRPIRSKTHSNYNSLEVVFPRSASAACIYVEFWLVHYIVCVLYDWLDTQSKTVLSLTTSLITGKEKLETWSLFYASCSYSSWAQRKEEFVCLFLLLLLLSLLVSLPHFTYESFSLLVWLERYLMCWEIKRMLRLMTWLNCTS